MTSIKLNRSKELLEKLKGELKAFLESEPYRIGTKRDNDVRLVYFLSEVREVPESIPTLIGEIIQNLRSALDHKVFELFTTNSTEEGRHICFPIDIDEVSYVASKERRTRGISQDAKNYIDSVKPYKEGNIILWQIHELNNLDKHRALVTSGSAFHSMDIGAHAMNLMMGAFEGMPKDFPKMPLFIKPADNLFPLKIGSELFIDGPGAKEISDMQFVFQIVINELGIAEGEEVISFIEKMITEVERIILGITNIQGI